MVISNEWYLKRERLVEVWSQTGNGTNNLEASRLARELFLHEPTRESAIAVFTCANRVADAEVNADTARFLLDDEAETLIAAGVLKPAEGM